MRVSQANTLESGMNIENGIQSLVDLGFTRLEADIYAFLLGNSPATGYRISQAIGKPAANVYNAVQSLEKKRAVLVEETAARSCRAVPVEELAARMQRHFLDKKTILETAFAGLDPAKGDDRIYPLRSPEQVFEKCRRMLENAREIVVVDAFPGALGVLKKDVEKAASRGVRIAVNAYHPVQIRGVRLFERPDGGRVIKRWPGEWINMVKDGEEYVLALLDGDLRGVIQAVWSESPYLSWVYYSALMSELELGGFRRRIMEGSDAAGLKKYMEACERFFPLEASGYVRLMKQVQPVKTKEKKK
jgi:sugar-specific transcriptional regulator TrmB